LRESVRNGKITGKRTLVNLSNLYLAQIEGIRAILKGQTLAPISTLFEITASRSHGHVEAVFETMNKLGFASPVAPKPVSRDYRISLSKVQNESKRFLCPDTTAVVCL